MELEGQKTIQLKYKTRREALYLTVFHFKLPKSRLENNLCKNYFKSRKPYTNEYQFMNYGRTKMEPEF